MGLKHHGYVNDITIDYDRETSLVRLYGVPQESLIPPFEALLTRRAAHLLWVRLTQALYPHEAPTMTSSASTTPLHAPEDVLLTNDIDFVKISGGEGYEVIGIVTNGEWRFRLTDKSAHRLWAAMDVTLFPVGWEGREGDSSDGTAEV